MLWAALESLGYRQLTTFWRLRGLAKYFRKNKEWGVMTREGFEGPSKDRWSTGFRSVNERTLSASLKD